MIVVKQSRTVPVSMPMPSLCLKVISRSLRNVVITTLALKRVPGWRPFTVYWDFASDEFMLKTCVTDCVWVLYRLKLDRLCCLWSFHVRRAAVAVPYKWMEDREAGTGHKYRREGEETRLKMLTSNLHQDCGVQVHRHSLKWNVFASRVVPYLLALNVMVYPLGSSTNRSDALQSGEHAEWSMGSTYTCGDVN